jgi:hypothetical protein
MSAANFEKQLPRTENLPLPLPPLTEDRQQGEARQNGHEDDQPDPRLARRRVFFDGAKRLHHAIHRLACGEGRR